MVKDTRWVIEPISLYGCEIWGPLANQEFEKWDKHQTETLHAELCKSILRTQRKTTNNACRAELGPFYTKETRCADVRRHKTVLTHASLNRKQPT